MEIKFNITELKDIIIEDLIDSDFDPNKHDTYAWVYNAIFLNNKECPRTKSFFASLLTDINWFSIEEQIKKSK